MMIPFTKMHGLGNDYLFIDHWDGDEASLSQWTIAISDRHRGVGSDGVILVKRSTLTGVDLDVEIINADGSRAELCCNGLRCAMRWAKDRDVVSSAEISAKTGGGIVQGVVGEDGVVTLRLPPPTWGPVAVGAAGLSGDPTPMDLGDGSHVFHLVSTGNPHAILFGEDPRVALSALAPLISGHDAFPAGINVHGATVISRSLIETLPCERGAGETRSCGSGAVAVAAVAMRAGWCGDEVDVRQPGGTLTVSWPDHRQSIQLRGPTAYIFNGTIHRELK
jgi:diaminopimelate epimerase